MEIYEVTDFIESMKSIEGFLSELASRESELRYAGLGSSKLWQSYSEAQEHFDGFDRRLHELIRLSKFVDKDLYERINDIAATSKLAESITQISVSVRISKRRRDRDIVIRKAANSMLDVLFSATSALVKLSPSSRKGPFFADFDVSMSDILVGLARLIPLADQVADSYYKKHLGDDEIFKPANIDVASIHVYVQNTISILQESGELGPETKTRLLEYLEEIRLGLAEATPQWRKVVGALVIVSTVLGGLAVAPQAIENVQKAVTEILGTSIEKQYPHSVPEEDTEFPKLTMT